MIRTMHMFWTLIIMHNDQWDAVYIAINQLTWARLLDLIQSRHCVTRELWKPLCTHAKHYSFNLPTEVLGYFNFFFFQLLTVTYLIVTRNTNDDMQSYFFFLFTLFHARGLFRLFRIVWLKARIYMGMWVYWFTGYNIYRRRLI